VVHHLFLDQLARLVVAGVVLKQAQDLLLQVLVVVWGTVLELELQEHRDKDFLEEMELMQQTLQVVEVELVLLVKVVVH
jgi:hypothetical protein